MRAISAAIRHAARVLALQASVAQEAERILMATAQRFQIDASRLPYLDREFAREVDRRLRRWKKEVGLEQDLYALGFRPATYLYRGALIALRGHPDRDDEAGNVLTDLVFFRNYQTSRGGGTFYDMVADRLMRTDSKQIPFDPDDPGEMTDRMNKFLFGNARNRGRNSWRDFNRKFQQVSIHDRKEELGDAIEEAMVDSVHRVRSDDMMVVLMQFPGVEKLLDKALDALVPKSGTLQEKAKDRLKEYMFDKNSPLKDLQDVAVAILRDEVAGGADYDVDTALRDMRTKRTREFGKDAKRLNSIKVTISQLFSKAERLGPSILERIRQNPETVFGRQVRDLEKAVDALRSMTSSSRSVDLVPAF